MSVNLMGQIRVLNANSSKSVAMEVGAIFTSVHKKTPILSFIKVKSNGVGLFISL